MKHLLLSLPGSSESLRHFVPKPEFSTSKNCIISELVLNIMQSVFLSFILVFLLILRQEKLFHAGLLAKNFCAVFFLPKEIYTSNNIVSSVDHLKTTHPLQWRDHAGLTPTSLLAPASQKTFHRRREHEPYYENSIPFFRHTCQTYKHKNRLNSYIIIL